MTMPNKTVTLMAKDFSSIAPILHGCLLSILLCLTGVCGVTSLPVEQYPDLAPPTYAYHGKATGASAQTLEKYRPAVIEQNMTGLDNLMYRIIIPHGNAAATGGDVASEALRRARIRMKRCSRCKPAAIGPT